MGFPTAIMMRHHFLLLTFAVSFCAALPATDLVVPEREEVDFVAYSTSASFIQAMAKSGGTEEDCRTFATTTIATTKESIESEQKTLDAVDKGAECAQEGQEMVTSTQGTLNKAQSDLAIKKGAAETALSAKETACTASVAFDVNLDTLTSKECFNYKQESTYTIADGACTSAKSDLTKADLAVSTAKTAVTDGQQANEDALAQAAELMSSCHCRVQQEQAAAWTAASSATAANAADWKQAHEVLCAVDQTANECEYDACPTVSQPTVAPGVAEEACSSFKLVKTGAECLSSDSQLPAPDSSFRYATAAECAAAVQAKGGKFFIYGTGDKKGKCYQEDTKSEDCEEGWETDQYDFYKFQQPESQPVVDEDMCECSGNSNRITCSITRAHSCAAGSVCDGKDKVKFGEWSKICTPKASLDMCKCTGESNEYECTKTGKAHCATGQVCDGIDEVKFGNLRQIESEICDVNMCKCTGNSNEYECTVTGKGHCAVSEKCDGSVVTYDQIASNLCGA